jgi:hypothetical protein
MSAGSPIGPPLMVSHHFIVASIFLRVLLMIAMQDRSWSIMAISLSVTR